ncbi:MAG: Txe/YoeB family addiction module toxin [Desulfobacterales bacterium]|nr:MAG: Txe/YoeB family addiction module toxin [Desulfobacterales bacterium]
MISDLRLVLSKKNKKSLNVTIQGESVFQPEFRDDLKYWVESDRKIALRIFQLIESIMREPFQGIGKPEPLKFLGSGVWSRRITQEHRLVYVVASDKINSQSGEDSPSLRSPPTPPGMRIHWNTQ